MLVKCVKFISVLQYNCVYWSDVLFLFRSNLLTTMEYIPYTVFDYSMVVVSHRQLGSRTAKCTQWRFTCAQVAEAANDAAFRAAVADVADWAEASGFENTENIAFSHQEMFVSQPIRRYRYLFGVFRLKCCLWQHPLVWVVKFLKVISLSDWFSPCRLNLSYSRFSAGSAVTVP